MTTKPRNKIISKERLRISSNTQEYSEFSKIESQSKPAPTADELRTAAVLKDFLTSPKQSFYQVNSAKNSASSFFTQRRQNRRATASRDGFARLLKQQSLSLAANRNAMVSQSQTVPVTPAAFYDSRKSKPEALKQKVQQDPIK